MLVILTGVEKICLEYGTASEQPIDHMTTAQAKKYMEEGQFGEGTMKPESRGSFGLYRQFRSKIRTDHQIGQWNRFRRRNRHQKSKIFGQK